MDVSKISFGSPLVFVPGWLATSAWWAAQVEQFTSRHRVLTLDYGWGGAKSIDDCAADLNAVLRTLGEPAIVIGWSMGAGIAMRCADRFGTLSIAGLVLVDQTPKSVTGPQWQHGVRGLDQDMLVGTPRLVHSSFASVAERVVAANFAVPPEAKVRDRLVGEALRWSPDVAARLIEDHWSLDYRAGLSRVDVPTLLVAGAQSAFTPIGAIAYLKAAIAGSSLTIIEHAGHAPFIERPQEFNRALSDFVIGSAA